MPTGPDSISNKNPLRATKKLEDVLSPFHETLFANINFLYYMHNTYAKGFYGDD